MKSINKFSTLFILLFGLFIISCDEDPQEMELSTDAFYVSYERQVLIGETGSQLACSGNPEYTMGHPTYLAKFVPIENAIGYFARVLKKDDTYADQFMVSGENLSDLGNGMIQYSQGVGSIFIFFTCSLATAEEEQQNRFDFLEEVGHQGVELTPIF